MPLIIIFTFLMSSVVMYRSNNDHNVVGCDIWFRIRPNLGPLLVTFRSLLTSSEVPKLPNFCYSISGSPGIEKNWLLSLTVTSAAKILCSFTIIQNQTRPYKNFYWCCDAATYWTTVKWKRLRNFYISHKGSELFIWPNFSDFLSRSSQVLANISMPANFDFITHSYISVNCIFLRLP